MKSPNKTKDKKKHLNKPSPIGKIKLLGATCSAAKAEYYKSKTKHSKAKAKKKRPAKKDLGPMSSAPGNAVGGAVGSF